MTKTGGLIYAIGGTDYLLGILDDEKEGICFSRESSTH